MNINLIILIITLVVVGYLIYHYIYPELVFTSTWKKIAGGDLNLNCWVYNFISTQIDSELIYYNQTIIGKELKTSEKVLFLREFMNQKYSNFTYSDTPLLDVMRLATQSSRTNLVESIYAIAEDIIPEEKPKTCGFVKPVEEEVSKLLLITITISESGMSTYSYSSIVRNNSEYCETVVDNKTCITNFLEKLENFATKKKSLLPEYVENKLDKCPNTLVYLDVKDLEKKTREQLNNVKESFSIIWKAILIESYDTCSKQLLEEMKDKSCPIIPKNKNIAVAEIMSDMGIFAYCSSDYIKNQLNLFNRELTISK